MISERFKEPKESNNDPLMWLGAFNKLTTHFDSVCHKFYKYYRATTKTYLKLFSMCLNAAILGVHVFYV